MKLLHIVLVGLVAVQAHCDDKGVISYPVHQNTCSYNTECPTHLACVRGKCHNPCEGACGNHANCEVREHAAYCSCVYGYTGCPLYGCVPEKVTEPFPSGCMTSEECDETKVCINEGCIDPCSVLACGSNHQCKVFHHTASCTPTVTDSPTISGRVTSSEHDCTLECSGDDQCSPDKACVDQHCVDPCHGRCGTNTTCRVVNHIPSCVCLRSHKGNPFEGCTYQTNGDCLDTFGIVTGKMKKYRIDRTKKVDWLEALLQCRKFGHRLATVMNEQELLDVKKAIRNTEIRGGNFWIAGTDHLHNNEWFWFTTNRMERIGAFTDWMQGQPDFDNEDCLEFWEANQQIGYKWNNRPCHEKHHFVCEYFE